MLYAPEPISVKHSSPTTLSAGQPSKPLQCTTQYCAKQTLCQQLNHAAASYLTLSPMPTLAAALSGQYYSLHVHDITLGRVMSPQASYILTIMKDSLF